MIYGHLRHSESRRFLVQNEIWRQAFESLSTLTPETPLGITQLRGPSMILNVHTYATRPRNVCRFESHRHTVDLQFMIAGGELIEWAADSQLAQDGPYDEQRDFQFYVVPQNEANRTRLHLTTGLFAIFFPCDAHRPQIQDAKHDAVRKAVVKIDTRLLEQS